MPRQLERSRLSAVHSSSVRTRTFQLSIHKILVRAQEWLVFSSKAFSLDQTKMNYAASIECADGVCKVLITNISYNYEEGRPTEAHYTAEEMIADKVAFNKKGTGFVKGGTKKFRIGTIDRMEQILNSFGYALK